ncbi:IS3 family transposase [Acidobacteriota bacterium]
MRLNDDQRRRLAVKGRALGRKGLEEVGGIVTPDTVLRWFRTLVGRKYDGSNDRRTGRPPTAKEIAELVVRIARENPRFGYTRIRDALRNFGHTIGRNTVKRILLEYGLEPAPWRKRKPSWRTFIKAHMDTGTIAAADFFTVEVLTLCGIVRYHVLFVMQLATRRVHVAGIAADPCKAWMTQVSRNLTDMVDGFLLGMRYIIMGRDPLFCAAFRQILKDSGVNPVRLPAKSPNLNAFAERFVLSIKSECLDRMILLGERHLRRVVSEFTQH